MLLAEIENLSTDDLKSRREELTSEAAKATKEELAARYLKTSISAKARDEKLAEQGKTIQLLQQAVEQLQADKLALGKKVAELNDWCAAHSTEAQQMAEKGAAERDASAAEIKRLKAELTETCKERDAANFLAAKRRKVLAELMSNVAPLLAEEG